MSVGGFSDKAKDDLVKMEANAEKLRRQINQIEFPDNGNPEKMKNGFENLYKSAKKFALGLLSVRTAYTIISKASSSYLATDDKTTNQLEANWVGLGTIMEPVIKFIIDLMKKAVTSVLYFMSVLTGVDYIAKANANALKKQENATNSLKKANDKLTASFDEMEVLSAPNASSVGTGSNVDTSALFDINDIGEDARKTIEKIGKALQPVYEVIRDIIKWCVDNPEVIIGMLGGLTLLSMLSKVIGVAGAGTVAGTGLSGILGLLLAIASVAVITISIKTIVDSAKDLHEVNTNLREMEKGARDSGDAMVEASKQFWDSAQKDSQAVQGMVDNSKMLFDSRSANIKQLLEEREEMAKNRLGIALLTGEWKNNSEALLTETELLYDNIEALKIGYDQGKLNTEQTKEYKKELEYFALVIDSAGGSVGGLTKTLGVNKEEAQKLMDKYDLVQTELKKLDKATDTTKVTFGDFTRSLSNTDIQSDETILKLKNVKGVMEELRKNDSVKMKVSADTSSASNSLSSWFSNLSSKIGTVFGISFPKIKLATGGIINNPGRGVPLGGAIGGEVNKEGVIPLTNSQAMEELGQTIGKYININLTNITQLNNRQIAREQKKINAQNDFAMNK